MKKLFRVFVVFLVLSLAFANICSASENARCGNCCQQPTLWNDFNKFRLKMSATPESGYSIWQGQLDNDTNDAQIDVEHYDRTKTVKGKILVVDGRVMAILGSLTQPGHEIDALYRPVLELKLLVRLLDEALPEGPSEVQTARKIDFTKEKTGIRVVAPRAEQFIPAPWRVRGEVRRIAPDVFSYQLTLAYTVRKKRSDKGKEQVVNLSGELSQIANARINDDMSLEDWKVPGLDLQIWQQGQSNYSTVPAITYRTVRDIRKKIAEDNQPDFIGFWKEKWELSPSSIEITLSRYKVGDEADPLIEELNLSSFPRIYTPNLPWGEERVRYYLPCGNLDIDTRDTSDLRAVLSYDPFFLRRSMPMKDRFKIAAQSWDHYVQELKREGESVRRLLSLAITKKAKKQGFPLTRGLILWAMH